MDNPELSRASERVWRGMSNDGRTLPPLGREGYPQETEGPWGREGMSHPPTNYTKLRRRKAKEPSKKGRQLFMAYVPQESTKPPH